MKAPILVQFEHHPGSTEATELADQLITALNGDQNVPGLTIPTCLTPNDGTLQPPEPVIAVEAQRALVVILGDDYWVANARRGGTRSWGEYAVNVREACGVGNTARLMPIQLSEHGWPIDQRLADLNALQAWAIADSNERRKFIVRRLIHVLIRMLRRSDAEEDGPPVTIFLSHAKLDIDHEPRPVRSLLAHLTAIQPEKTWFDTGDIAAGSRFAREIEGGLMDSALLAVMTDSYSSRAWCRREVLLAKRHERPVVIVDAVQNGEARRFPYAGNTPVVRWKGDPNEVVDLLLRETLRHEYSRQYLDDRKRSTDCVLPSGPELVTVVNRDRSQTILYPDPPLGPEEVAVLSSAGVTVTTPLQRCAEQVLLADRSLLVALSVSEAEDISRFGLRPRHLNEVFIDFSRYLLLAGMRLAYGGHLRAGGYTVQLADLLRDPLVDQIRGETPPDLPLPAQLVTFLPWPDTAGVHDEARLGSLVEVRRCERPPDVDEDLDPTFKADVVSDIPSDSGMGRFAWARGLLTMRERQTSETDARVIVGGRLSGYKGRMPGVLEEAMLSMRAAKPVFLIGAYGGCAKLVADALDGVSREELTWEFHRKVPGMSDLRELHATRHLQWDDFADVGSYLHERGWAGLNNGLFESENRELASTRSAEQMVRLVLKGLQRKYSDDDSEPPQEG